MKKWLMTVALAAPLLAHAAGSITIGFQKSSGLLGILKAQGTLEKSGQAVKWIEFPAGPQMLEALNAGSIDFGSTGAPPPVFGQAAGIDVLYVAAEPAFSAVRSTPAYSMLRRDTGPPPAGLGGGSRCS